MSYLFWAHIIVWLALFIYIFNLVRKNTELKKQIELLKGSLNYRGKEAENRKEQGSA